MLLGQFSVVRYVPDPVREEPVNVGVILEGVDTPFLDYRLVPDPRRLRLRPGSGGTPLRVALSNLRQLVAELKDEPEGNVLGALAKMCTIGLCVTEPRPCIAKDFAEKLDELFSDLAGEPARMKRHHVLDLFFKEVSRKGLQPHIRQGYSIRTEHDVLVVDAAFRCNGAIECVQGVSLAHGSGADASLSAARLVVYMWREIQESDRSVKKVTAVVRPPLSRVGSFTPEDLVAKAGDILTGHDCGVIRGDDEAEVQKFVGEVAKRCVPWQERPSRLHR